MIRIVDLWQVYLVDQWRDNWSQLITRRISIYLITPQLIKKKTTRLPHTRWYSQNCSFTEFKKVLRGVVNYVFILAWFLWNSISSLLLGLTKIVSNIVPLADKIDTDKDIGHVKVPLLLRLWPLWIVSYKKGVKDLKQVRFMSFILSSILFSIAALSRIENIPPDTVYM